MRVWAPLGHIPVAQFRPDTEGLGGARESGVTRVWPLPPACGCLLCGIRAPDQGCIRREGASEAALEAVRQAVGGGCQSGWGRLLSVTNAIEAGACRQGALVCCVGP